MLVIIIILILILGVKIMNNGENSNQYSRADELP